MKDWPHPNDLPPEGKWLTGGCGCLAALGIATTLYSAIAAVWR